MQSGTTHFFNLQIRTHRPLPFIASSLRAVTGGAENEMRIVQPRMEDDDIYVDYIIEKIPPTVLEKCVEKLISSDIITDLQDIAWIKKCTYSEKSFSRTRLQSLLGQAQ